MSVELNDVFVDTMTILHAKVVELVFGIPNGVMGAEIGAEFCGELLKVVHPMWTEEQVLLKQEVRLEPVKRHALEVRLHEDNLGMVVYEGKGAILIVQFALDQEDAKFAGVRPVKLFRFVDSRPEGRGGWRLQATGRVCQARDDLSQLG